jgi:hypothetical protein
MLAKDRENFNINKPLNSSNKPILLIDENNSDITIKLESLGKAI